jgi:hypothetical protein
MTMARMTCTAVPTDDRQSAVLQMHEDGKPLAHMILDAASLEGLIRDLARVRARLAEEVTPELDPGARIDIEASPAWKIPRTHTGPPGVVLALRHPGVGWLGFLLDKERAQAIGKALTKTPPAGR